MSEFRTVLQYLRVNAKLTQSELANKLGLAPSTIGMYETGRREPSFEILELIADYFNVDMNFLIGKQPLPHMSHIPLIERQVADIIEQLNDEGKKRLIEYGNLLLKDSNYTKAKGAQAQKA